MPWYKTGTVKTTINSNAIIGTGTAFISNSRVGDAFRGPDGKWYEVVNIASDTAMSISPNYQGPTVAAGTYSIAPMQGYVKESADALRGITNTYGTKLLDLGTTGNYEVLPVVKGGTGGTTPAAARTGLGLGTASTTDVVTSLEDITTGHTLRVGYAGLGLALTPSWTNLNDCLTNGVFRAHSEITNRPPFTSGDGDSYQHFNWNGSTSDGAAVQTYYSYSLIKSFIRAKRSGVWTAWEAQLRAADIVGTVASGAILERGSNSNGEYTKFLDGTLMTWGKQAVTASCPPGQAISWNPNQPALQPATFIGAWQSVIKYSMRDSAGVSLYVVEFSYVDGNGGLVIGGMNTGNSPNSSHPSFTLGPRTAVESSVHFFSIGRWK